MQFRQPFRKPTPAQLVKVRHQHYQGEAHPVDRKVSITLPVAQLALSSPAALHKFKLIAGPRWDSDKDELKISCELFPTDRMNEKWCSDMLDRMVLEAEVPLPSLAGLARELIPFPCNRIRRTRWLTSRSTLDRLWPVGEESAS